MRYDRSVKSSPAKSTFRAASSNAWGWAIGLLTIAGLFLSTSFGQGRVANPTHAMNALKPAQPAMPREVQRFIGDNCLLCHNKDSLSGGLNLAAMPFRPHDSTNFDFWVKVHDRVAAGEMPPKGA